MLRCALRMRFITPVVAAAGLLAGLPLPAPSRAGTLAAERDPLVRNMDSSVKPGDDFFRYACGRWLRENPIPPTESSWGIGDLVREETYLQRRQICESAAASGAARGSVDQKVGDFWLAGMDTAAIESRGAAPLAPYLAEIAAIGTREDLVRVIGEFQRRGCLLYTSPSPRD